MKQDNDDIKMTINHVPEEPAAIPEDIVSLVNASEQDASTTQSDADGDVTASPETSASAEEKKREDGTNDATPHRNTLENIVQEDAHESEVQPPSSFSLNKMLGGAILARIIQSQIRLMILVFVFLIIYITCRYQCQQKMVEIDHLEQQLISIRYKATVFTSILTEKSRESNIMNMLDQKGDSTLEVPKEPPYKINIPKD